MAFLRRMLIALLVCFGAIPSYALDVAVGYAPTTLDPARATSAAGSRLLSLVAPGLVSLQEDFTIAPELATKWQVEEHQTYTFTLDAERAFHDGTPVTAHAVQAWLAHVQNPATASPLAASLSGVAEMRTPAPETLIITLNKPDLLFLEKLHTLPIAKMSKDKTPIGAGPYRFVRKDAHGNVELKKVTGVGPDVLHFWYVKDPLVRLMKLQAGEVGVVHNDVPIELMPYAERRGFAVQSMPSASYTYLGFNHNQGPTTNRQVRLALAHALDISLIQNTLLQGYASPATSLLLPEHPAAMPIAAPGYDPEKAKTLLDKAGFLPDAEGVRLTLPLAITNNPLMQRLAQVMRAQLAEVGIELTIQSSAWATFYSRIKRGEAQLYILTWVGRFAPDIFTYLFHSEQWPSDGLNRGRFANPAMDVLLERMQDAATPEVLYAYARDVQKFQASELIFMPLWRRHHVLIHTPDLTGCGIDVTGGYQGLLTCR